MDSDRFNDLVRALGDMSSRRSTARFLAATAIGGVLANSTQTAEGGERCKRRCKACRKLNRRRCPNNEPPEIVLRCEDGRCPPGSVGVCTSNDGFCESSNGKWAYCLEKPECGCFNTVEGDQICGNIENFTGCPATTECTSSAECGGETSFCVDLECCPEGKAACRPLCVT